jgi:phosphatidate cytidylyltransferase
LETPVKKYSNLTQRLITGILGAAAIIAGVSYGEWTYFAIFFLICLFTLLEFYNLVGLDGLAPQKAFGTISGILIFCLSFLIEGRIKIDGSGPLPAEYYILIFPIISCIYMIKLYKKFERKPFTNIAYTFLGICYVVVPFVLLNVIVFDEGRYNFEIILGSLLILWASDTGAYFAGTFFGRRKLFERISPKKSWEGFIGGALLAMLFAYGSSQYLHTLSVAQWIIVGILIIVGGTFGDLVESLLKRSIEIKDSGDALPGHGGFLDRFDGLLISAPFIAAYLEIF